MPSENPSHSLFSAQISVPEEGLVELFVYDVSGRIIAGVSREFTIGLHSINFYGLTEGVYFCVMRSGDFTTTEKVVILE